MRGVPRKTRVVNGKREFCCTRCGNWKPEECFHRAPSCIFGRRPECGECRKPQDREKERRNDRLRRRRRRRIKNHIDTRYDAEKVRAWILDAQEHDPSLSIEEIARRIGRNRRAVYRVMMLENKKTTQELAEAIAIAIGRPDLLIVDAPDLGMDGWGPRGERMCLGCGRADRAHYGRGLCEPCWNRDRRKREKMAALTAA